MIDEIYLIAMACSADLQGDILTLKKRPDGAGSLPIATSAVSWAGRKMTLWMVARPLGGPGKATAARACRRSAGGGRPAGGPPPAGGRPPRGAPPPPGGWRR